MRITAKLYGTLSGRFPGYQRAQGIEAEIPDGATVKDLLALLEISESKGAVVAMEGRVLKGMIQYGAESQCTFLMLFTADDRSVPYPV